MSRTTRLVTTLRHDPYNQYFRQSSSTHPPCRPGRFLVLLSSLCPLTVWSCQGFLQSPSITLRNASTNSFWMPSVSRCCMRDGVYESLELVSPHGGCPPEQPSRETSTQVLAGPLRTSYADPHSHNRTRGSDKSRARNCSTASRRVVCLGSFLTETSALPLTRWSLWCVIPSWGTATSELSCVICIWVSFKHV